MSLHQELVERVESFFASYGEFVNFDEFIDWDGVNEILTASPQLIWNGNIRVFKGESYMATRTLAYIATIYQNIDELKFLNSLIRDNSSPELVQARLSLAFERDNEEGEPADSPVTLAAGIGNLEMLKYLVEECCPSSYAILEADGNGYSALNEAIYNGKIDVVDYILSVAPRGLNMLNDVYRPVGLTNLQIGTNEAVSGEGMKEYLENVNLIFLEREHGLTRQAREALQGEGYELPDLMLGVAGENTQLLHSREKLR